MVFRLSLAFALMLLAALAALVSQAADSRGLSYISLNDGSTIQDYAWWDEDELLLYTVNPDGAILWKHNIATGAREKIITATGMASLLRITDGWDKVTFDLSPSRGYISFYAPPDGPLKPPLFRVVEMAPGKMSAVEFTKLPDGFIIGKHAWDNTDKYIYLAAQDYSSPDTDIILGRLSLETGAFLALAVKDQIDLVNELEYDSQSNALLITSRSYAGEYPRGEFLLQYSLNDNSLVKLSEAYEFRGIQATASGDIIAAEVSKSAFRDGSYPGFLMVDESFRLPENPDEGKDARVVSQILLIPPEGESQVLLDSQDRGFDFEPGLSPNGEFLAFKRMYYRLPTAVEVRMPDNEIFLCLRERKSAQEYLVMRGAESYRFSPGSRFIAARSADRSYLNIFELPRS
jgi:hypothetical protein